MRRKLAIEFAAALRTSPSMPQFAGTRHARGGREDARRQRRAAAFGSGAVGVWGAVNFGIEGGGSECRGAPVGRFNLE